MIEKITGSNFYKSKALTNSLKFVSEKSAIFTAGTSLAFATVVRPLSTLAAPKTPKEDKKISFAKSISSALTGFLFTAIVSTPFSKAVKNIDKNPKKYLQKDTIKNLSDGLDNVSDSKSYKIITQLFKLGLGFLLAYPKAITNNIVISKLINKKTNEPEKEKKDEDNISQSFKGGCEKMVSSVINNKTVQKAAKKLKDTSYTTHLIALGDIFSTLAFTTITSKNKKLNEHQKKVLNYNAAISTALCLFSGYGLDKITDKPMEKFIDNLKKANKNSPDLSKYIEGAKIVKTSLIFATVYYGLISFLSTIISSKLADNKKDAGLEKENNI